MKAIFRAVLVVCAVAVVLAIVGILRFRQTADEITISIDKQKSADVMEKSKELGSEAIEKASESLKQLKNGSTETEESPDNPDKPDIP